MDMNMENDNIEDSDEKIHIKDPPSKPTIKNIVISGGGHTLIQFLGILKHLEEQCFYNRKNIEKIYAVSAGTIIAALLCLDFDWDTIIDYFIKRPWHEVYKFDINTLFNTYHTKGLYDTPAFEVCFKPLFDAKDISLSITLSEFFELTGKELHFYTVEINEFEYVDVSYKTYPNLSLMKAIQMSCGLPVLIVPVCIENKCFIDGGVYCNYPISFCLEDKDSITCNLEEETLGIKKCRTEEIKNTLCINKDSKLIEYITGLLGSIISRVSLEYKKENKNQPTKKIKNEVLCESTMITMENMYSLISSQEKRQKLLDNGVECGKKFLQE